jgi:response regulator NasT
VVGLGHEVVVQRDPLEDIGAVTAAERPDVALVIVGEAGEHALALIDRIVREATCPVIAVLDVNDRLFVMQAARKGIFAYIAGDDAEDLQSSIDIVLRRSAEYHNLEGAFGRRAVTERAKGILMERHGIDELEAFQLLREHSRRTQRKLIDVAEDVISSHRLLPARPQSTDAPAADEAARSEPST